MIERGEPVWWSRKASEIESIKNQANFEMEEDLNLIDAEAWGDFGEDGRRESD